MQKNSKESKGIQIQREEVQKHPKNGHFTSACLAHGTFFVLSGSLSYITPIFADWRRLAEVHEIICFIIFYLLQNVQNLNISKFEFFKISSFKLKNKT